MERSGAGALIGLQPSPRSATSCWHCALVQRNKCPNSQERKVGMQFAYMEGKNKSFWDSRCTGEVKSCCL
jgi:hypothetical protein